MLVPPKAFICIWQPLDPMQRILPVWEVFPKIVKIAPLVFDELPIVTWVLAVVSAAPNVLTVAALVMVELPIVVLDVAVGTVFVVSPDKPPPAAAHAPSPRRKVDELQVPVQRASISALAAFDRAPVVVVFFTMPVPRVAQFWLLVPKVCVAVLATPDPPLAAGSTPLTSAVRETAEEVTADSLTPSTVAGAAA